METIVTKKSLYHVADHTEQTFAKLFFSHQLDNQFWLHREKRLLIHPTTAEASLPDFEIIPKNPEQFAFEGCIIETTWKNLNSPKKNRQRRAVLGWIHEHPGYFFLEFTLEVLELRPEFVDSITSIFEGNLTAESLQGKIAAVIYSSKDKLLL